MIEEKHVLVKIVFSLHINQTQKSKKTIDENFETNLISHMYENFKKRRRSTNEY